MGIEQAVSETIIQKYRCMSETEKMIPLDRFAQTRRGLALAFWALNKVWRDHKVFDRDIFHVENEEWQTNILNDYWKCGQFRPLGSDPIFVFDIHTHFVAGKSREDDLGTPPWWWCPQRYNFSSKTIKFVRADTTFKQYVRDIFFNSDTNVAGLSTGPRPVSDGLLSTGDDVDWLSVAQMQKASALINSAAGHPLYPPRLLPSGAIGLGAQVEPNKDEPKSNDLKVWKIYPPHGVGWGKGNYGQLGSPMLREFFPARAQRALENIPDGKIVCIHWQNDVDPSYALETLCENLPAFNDKKFIIFHAAYPEHAALAKFLWEHENIYAEMGDTFDDFLVMLGLPNVGAPPNPNDQNDPRGTHGRHRAQEFLHTLLGFDPEGRNSTEVTGPAMSRILWGTDAIWRGSTQWQIEAFWRIKIWPDVELATEQDFKARVLGQNAGILFGINAPSKDDELQSKIHRYREVFLDPDMSTEKVDRCFDDWFNGKFSNDLLPDFPSA